MLAEKVEQFVDEDVLVDAGGAVFLLRVLFGSGVLFPGMD